ncbi:MAG: excinuclease ABC subunit UvrA, partial [Planctomycetota bacterium]
LCAQVEEWFHGKDPAHADERFHAVMREDGCPECHGERIGRAQRHVLVGGRSLGSFTHMTVDEAHAAMASLRLRKTESSIAADILVEIRNRLSFLRAVGLGYLGLDRSAATLSGGEAQRIRLATQLGNRLVGVLYVLDEPTIGLHPRDTERLLATLFELRDLGNTVVAVEHDESVIRRADWVVDMGPGAGHRGGEVVASGTPVAVADASDALTGRYLRGELGVPIPTTRRLPLGHVVLEGCDLHNLKGFDARFPLGVLTAVTGVSGSGKSTLVLDTLVPILDAERARLEGVGRARLVVVDQGPIGTTPSSNPATYTGVFTPIRELFAALPVSRMKGFGVGRFSFNVSGGRCDACEGKGHVRVEMHFLADVWVPCEVCRARRYNAETLSVEMRGKSIADVLEMEIDEAVDFFGNQLRIARPLKLLQDVGLGYLRLGQAANTLSGGEAQR